MNQTYICPNCQGKGCAVCQNTGKVSLSDQEVQELQKLMVKPSLQTQNSSFMDYPTDPQVHQEQKMRGQLAGILTIVFLVLVSVTGVASWFIAHSLKPFFQLWSFVAAILLLRWVSHFGFFQEEKINDFVGKIQDEGVQIKMSPFYPLFE